jgi:hypothetical protein
VKSPFKKWWASPEIRRAISRIQAAISIQRIGNLGSKLWGCLLAFFAWFTFERVRDIFNVLVQFAILLVLIYTLFSIRESNDLTKVTHVPSFDTKFLSVKRNGDWIMLRFSIRNASDSPAYDCHPGLTFTAQNTPYFQSSESRGIIGMLFPPNSEYQDELPMTAPGVYNMTLDQFWDGIQKGNISLGFQIIYEDEFHRRYLYQESDFMHRDGSVILYSRTVAPLFK